MWVACFGFVYVILSNSVSATSLFADIDAHVENCFAKRMRKNDMVAFHYEVVEGGFYDVDAKFYAPDGKELHASQREGSGRFLFPVQMDGKYKVCFSNQMSSKAPKTVMFSIESPKNYKVNADGDKTNRTVDQLKLEEMVAELSVSLSRVKSEQEYMDLRQAVHREINDTTNKRVVLWALFESIIMLAMTIGQVYYLKRFFEVRRIV